MKKFLGALSVMLVLGLAVLPALAGEAGKHGKSHDMTVEFLSYDVKAKTVTFKTDSGETKTAPVMDEAVKTLSAAKAGDKLMFTCADNDKGEHQGVAMAKPAPAAKQG